MELPTIDIATLWEAHYPQLADANDASIQRLMENAKMMRFPAHCQVITPGTICEHYLLVTGGSLRVQVVTDSGREVVLYHVRSGDACILTTSCLFSGEPFPAEGITETEVTVLALSAAEFNRALGDSSIFRRFVFTKFSQRMAGVIARMSQVCSAAIDRNLAGTLLNLSDGGTPIAKTHQELASELGTAREVVSRHLKRFESSGWVSLGRGTIEIKAPEVLARISKK